jgi:hypothetical protein
MNNISILLLALCPVDVPRVSDATERAYDLAELTPQEAVCVAGRRARFVVQLDSLPEEEGRYTSYDADAPLGLHASVYFIGESGWDGLVEATLQVIEHRAWLAPDGTRIEGFSEYWLAGEARRCIGDLPVVALSQSRTTMRTL